MALKVILFDFNGVILDDEPIHAQLIQELMLGQNLRFALEEVQQVCLGRSDRAALEDLLRLRGRILPNTALDRLIADKHRAYQERLATLESTPVFPSFPPFLDSIRQYPIKLGIVSGAQRSEIEGTLTPMGLKEVFEVIVAAEDIRESKPSPEGYQNAIAQFQQRYPEEDLQPANFLAIEDSFPGLEATRRAKIPVVGIAHTYPFHMMQRQANWAVDSFEQLDIERLLAVYDRNSSP
jgi:beta-phosphoglucomutase-like phosphatase (HAD superfamily)